jgi:hypothetical protein
MIVAIHQPNFFPWPGYFDKIARADVFCLLDTVQFPKTGGTWINRVQLRVNGKATWVTAPIDRSYSGVRRIMDMRTRPEPWRERFLRALHCNYARAPAFAEVLAFLTPLVLNRCDNLSQYNVSAIRTLCDALGLGNKRFVLASQLKVSGQATELLVNITREVGGTAYLCGGGAAEYQEDAKFAQVGLRLVYQDFQHSFYPQIGAVAFTPGLSVIDMLMNVGFVETSRRLTKDRDLCFGLDGRSHRGI